MDERRTQRRYPLRLPVTVREPGKSAGGEIFTETKDVSSRGLYFVAKGAMKKGAPLEMIMTLPPEITRAEAVRVRCEGRVQRSETVDKGKIGVAVKIESYRFLPSKRERRKAS